MMRNYVLKVWGSTIVVAPVLIMLVTAIIGLKQGTGFDAGAFGFIAFAIGYGFVLSLPTFLLVYLLYSVLQKRVSNSIKLKVITLLIGVACVLVTFSLLYGKAGYDLNGNYAAWTFSVTYTICLIVFSLLYSV